MQKHILNFHNKIRSIIASGGISHLPTAARMRTLQWDDELSFLADLNTKQCQMKHDSCHGTPRFLTPGQNLAMRSSTGSDINIDQSLEIMLNKWANEYKNLVADDVKNLNNVQGIGHFTAIIKDKTTRLGCAMSKNIEGNWQTLLLACNYSLNNIIAQTVYDIGLPASKCLSGENKLFAGLCNVGEPI